MRFVYGHAEHWINWMTSGNEAVNALRKALGREIFVVMRFAIVARRETATNQALASSRVDGVAWEILSPEQALEVLRPGDVALGRLDVTRNLDGVDDGLWALGALMARGIVVLNHAAALLATHDKLLTARLLRRHGFPHPATIHVRENRPRPVVGAPAVVKPRFGSGGADVFLCEDERELQDTLDDLRERPWYVEQGALVQELVPPQGHDLRILVARGRVVGAVSRVAAPHEWRTNISLGGHRVPVPDPPGEACALAIAAARAADADLVGVDLMPDWRGRWIIIELNGAVEFTHEYKPGSDVFVEVSREFARLLADQSEGVAVRAALT